MFENLKEFCEIESGYDFRPLLVHLKNEDGDNILTYAVMDNIFLRWRSSEEYIFKYVTGQITLKDLILSCDDKFYKLSHFNNSQLSTILTDLPNSFLPSDGCYYTSEIPIEYEYMIVDVKINKLLK